MSENARLIYDLLQYTEDKNIPGWLLLFDSDKAFDSLSWYLLCLYLFTYIGVQHDFHISAFHLQIIFDNNFKENILKTICNWTKSYFISCIQKRNRPLIFKRGIGLQFVFLITMFVIVWNSCNDSLHLIDWHFTMK
jgi:hypothetical protein